MSMEAVAGAMVAPGKGILAADESTGTIKKRFDGIGVESTETTRRDYREMLFTTKDIGNYIGGVILFDETLRQSAKDGTPFAKLMRDQGMIPGIKVDQGAKDLAGFPGEKITEGLTGLRERLSEYRSLGAGFAKWRAVITIDNDLPSDFCIRANAHALARYAALCQEAGIVPIVEPEVLMDGEHSLERCQEVTEHTLNVTFSELAAHRVVLEQMILKPNMVISAKNCTARASREQVAEETVKTLKRCVPTAVPGIAFLSGGQTEQEATEHLSLMNAMGPLPWELSFSYGRALQESALKAWAGKRENFPQGQAKFTHRSQCNSAARDGSYRSSMESEA